MYAKEVTSLDKRWQLFVDLNEWSWSAIVWIGDNITGSERKVNLCRLSQSARLVHFYLLTNAVKMLFWWCFMQSPRLRTESCSRKTPRNRVMRSSRSSWATLESCKHHIDRHAAANWEVSCWRIITHLTTVFWHSYLPCVQNLIVKWDGGCCFTATVGIPRLSCHESNVVRSWGMIRSRCESCGGYIVIFSFVCLSGGSPH